MLLVSLCLVVVCAGAIRVHDLRDAAGLVVVDAAQAACARPASAAVQRVVLDGEDTVTTAWNPSPTTL